MELLKELYEAYQELKKEEVLVEVKEKERKKVKLFQLRKLLVDPPIFFIVNAQIIGKNKVAYEVIPHTEFVELARTYLPYPYYIFTKTETLVPLPFTIILCPEFIEKYSKVIKEEVPRKIVEDALIYVQKTKLPVKGIYKKFLDEERERLQKYDCSFKIQPISLEEALKFEEEKGVKIEFERIHEKV